MLKYLAFLSLSIFNFISVLAQNTDSLKVEVYVYDERGGAYLPNTQIKIFSTNSLDTFAGISDEKGKVTLAIPNQNNVVYELLAELKGFKLKKVALTGESVIRNNASLYVKLPMSRAMGYMLDVSLSEFVEDKNEKTAQAFAIEGATIEVYNNTLHREELRLVAHPSYRFNFFMEQGNEYIFMVRKKGFYTKRMRANVNINGCLLCMEGFGTLTPGVADNLTNNNTVGVLVTNISMKKVTLNETVKIENIYYDVASAALRKEAKEQLNKLAELLKDNPQVIIELTSHTDSRGSKEKNLALSQLRADGVVQYLREQGVAKNQITGKGMGEEKPLNSCVDGVKCSDEMYQVNRRTEFTVVQILKDDAIAERPLASIMYEANLETILENATEFVMPEAIQSRQDDKGNHIWHSSIKLGDGKNLVLPQVIENNFTGFAIELFSQEEAPNTQDGVFYNYNPTYLYTDEEMTFFSILLGQFESQELAKIDWAELKKIYPQARIVAFENGIMLD